MSVRAEDSATTGAPPLEARRPRVLMIGPLPPPVGGMATVVASLSQALTPHAEVQVVNNVKTTPPGRSLLQAVAAHARLLGRITGLVLRWRPQVVHIHTCSRSTFWRNAVDVLLARALGRAVVLHVHGAEFHQFLAGLKPAPARAARLVFRACSRVFVLGEGWKRVLAPWVSPPERIVVVPNGVAAAGEPADPGAAEAVAVVCLANYEARKGQADLVRAVAAMPKPKRLRLRLFGAESEPGAQGDLGRLAAELGLADLVHLGEPITAAEVAEELRRAAVFCLPSYNEGLPMAMLEAMAHGVPLLVTSVGSIPEVVADGDQGFVVAPGDIPALAARLEALAGDPELRRRMGARARETLAERYSLDAAAGRTAAVYRELAGMGRHEEASA